MSAEQLAKALGGKRAGRQWVCPCPAHEDSSPSLIIFEGKSRVQVRCLAGCDQGAVIDALKARRLWFAGDDVRTPSHGFSGLRKSVSHETVEASRDAARQHLAEQIFNDSREVEGTLGERYLASRDLWSERVLAIADVRYHSRCPRGGDRVPALVIAMRSLVGARFRAVQRIFIPDGKKLDAMMLGSVSGAAMKLTPHHETFAGELAYCEQLTVCEGLETGLACLHMDYTNVWALGSAGAIAMLPVLFGVGSLLICADNDAPRYRNGVELRAGQDAAQVCMSRWRSRGVQVSAVSPDREGCDLADVWSDHVRRR